MKACAVLSLLLPAFPFFRVAYPARYFCLSSSLVSDAAVLYGLLSGINFLCLKSNHSELRKHH